MMEKRSALGKGLSALIPERAIDLQEKEGKDAAILKVLDIQYNSVQPRLHYDQENLEELIASIREKGVLQPILVRPKGEGYEVIAGERRLRAAQALGLEEIPVVLEHYVEVSSRDRLSDEVTVHVAVSDASWTADRIAERLLSRLRVKPSVLVEPVESVRDQVFSPKYRKPMRFVDRRSP